MRFLFVSALFLISVSAWAGDSVQYDQLSPEAQAFVDDEAEKHADSLQEDYEELKGPANESHLMAALFVISKWNSDKRGFGLDQVNLIRDRAYEFFLRANINDFFNVKPEAGDVIALYKVLRIDTPNSRALLARANACQNHLAR